MPAKKKVEAPKTEVHNRTNFTQEQIDGFTYIGATVNKFRGRNIRLYQHPEKPDCVISVGTTFNNDMIVIAEEPKRDWVTALNYIANGKVYVSE